MSAEFFFEAAGPCHLQGGEPGASGTQQRRDGVAPPPFVLDYDDVQSVAQGRLRVARWRLGRALGVGEPGGQGDTLEKAMSISGKEAGQAALRGWYYEV